MSFTDALADFIGAMEIEGIRTVEPIAQRLSSGELIRFRCDGDGTGRQNGWAILYLDDRPAGAFGNYRLGISRKWRVDRDLSLTADERQAMQREWAAAKLKRQEERDRTEAEAMRDAADMWSGATPALTSHPYAARKDLVVDGLRQSGAKLLIPMFDSEGMIRNIQRVAPDSTKRFLRGGRTEGLFCLIGRFTRRGETACIGEGYATMSALHKATGHPCIASFSAANIPAVARLWWSHRADLDYIICGDDDPGLKKNVGRLAAEAAAEEIGARIAFPFREAA